MMKTFQFLVLLLASLAAVEGCTDKWTQCDNLKSFCESVAWVKSDCPKACSVCTVVQSTTQYTVVSDGWSACTKTCGAGTRHKTLSNGNKEYEACNTQDCPQAFCFGQVRRKGIPHSCCTPDTFSSCGNPEIGGRVIGGSDTTIEHHPWMAAIKSNNGKFCAAVIISNMWLVSAGHCFRSSSTRQNFDYSTWTIYVGSTSAYDVYYGQNIPAVNIKEIQSVIFHPEHYFPKADIVLIKLKTALTFSNKVKPVCLPGGEVTPKDTKCFIAGWGVSNANSPSLTDILQEGIVSNYDMDICKVGYKGSKFDNFLATDSRLLCAGNLHTLVDTCVGDSGGALVCQRCSSCRYYLAGVVSFGSTNCDNKKIPGIYTRIKDYENWIGQTTGVWSLTKSCGWSVGP